MLGYEAFTAMPKILRIWKNFRGLKGCDDVKPTFLPIRLEKSNVKQ